MPSLAGEVARRAGGVSHPRIIPQGKQKGRYDPPHGNKTAIMAAAWRTEGVLRPRAEFIKSQFKFSNKVICQVSFKFVSGLFPRFYASDSPLSSL